MKKYKYIKISNSKKLRYLDNYYRKNLYIVFLHGFMSNIEGEKPKAFKKYSDQKKLGFLAMEYSGHGKSSGRFIQGNISKWSKDAELTIKKIVKKNDFILIGSSMGAWISLKIFKYFKNQIKGLIGIGSAPEFVTRIMWKKFSTKIKQEIISKGISYVKQGEYEYPITHQLIKNGRNNKVLSRRNLARVPVTMIHGSKDDVVPVLFSRKVLANFKHAKKRLVVVKNGDHSLSSKSNIKKILKELDKIVSNII